MNRLQSEKSAYLRHAAHQKIDWYPWSEEPFEKAKKEQKPVFMSSGAMWCHWCHVMAAECFDNEEIADVMNELFINIKLDRDERPDIDRRYQQAVSAMGAGGGWPLSVFLTPDKEPFFGGTYFPPGERSGIPGFKQVLHAVGNFYKIKQEEAVSYARQVLETLRPDRLIPGELNEGSLDEAVTGILSSADAKSGGFGGAPKFPMPGAVEFLVHRFFLNADPEIATVVHGALEAMARGGIHDQLGGGFHRYSVDAEWIVPHFEKMADDNAWLLRTYGNAYAVFRDERYRTVAEGILRFTREVLSDPEGGFYASQDADVTPADEGGYFTWTRDEAQRVLAQDEFRVLSLYFFHERGSMHHDQSKHVLSIAMEPQQIAEQLGMDSGEIERLIFRGRQKLLNVRNARTAPFVDKTLYTSLNGLLISAYLHVYRILREPQIKKFALLSLDRIMSERLTQNTLMHSDGVPALLDDYVFLIDALTAAYEVTADGGYLSRAEELMEHCTQTFLDRGNGGFFDTDREVLATRLKRIEDIPHPSANAVAIMLLLKLSSITKKESYRTIAEEALRAFSGSALETGIHAGSYFCALDAYYHMLAFTIEAPPLSPLAQTAVSFAGPYTAVTYGENRDRVIPCIREVCYSPLHDPAELRNFVLNHYAPKRQ